MNANQILNAIHTAIDLADISDHGKAAIKNALSGLPPTSIISLWNAIATLIRLEGK